MKLVEEILLIMLTLFCTQNYADDSQLNRSANLSPLDQFESVQSDGMWVERESVENILKTYGLYDKIMSLNKNEEPLYSDVKILGEIVGDKKVAVLLIQRGHQYIYVMFSKTDDQWCADGIVSQSERFEPEYRIEKTIDGMKYWLVVKDEVNHGTGISIYDEIWYNPEGSIAAEYPLEGYSLFFPEQMAPSVTEASFIAYPYFDGDSKIHLDYSVSFTYDYESNSDKTGFSNVFHSEYNPSIRDYWTYNLAAKKLNFESSNPALSERLSEIEHRVSSEYGIMQGYIDFYDSRLGDKKITSLEEWEQFIKLK